MFPSTTWNDLVAQLALIWQEATVTWLFILGLAFLFIPRILRILRNTAGTSRSAERKARGAEHRAAWTAMKNSYGRPPVTYSFFVGRGRLGDPQMRRNNRGFR